jgi:hypothetical protein
MTQRELVNETLVVRSCGPKDLGRIIDLAMAGQVMRIVLAACGSRSPPGERRPR